MHDRKILQTAYHMLSNLQDAQDVYQDTFLRAYRKIDSYRFDGSFEGWLTRIAVNLAINKRKQRQRRRFFALDEASDSQLHSEIGEALGSTEKKLASRELYDQVNGCLDSLSPKQRTAFVMKHFEGYKISEISEVMQCAEGTVKNYLFRATQKLQRKLKPLLT